MKVMVIRTKRKVKCERFHVRRKMKENNGIEYNRGLNDKKNSEDQFMAF